jgi:hypothetical protein
MVRFGQKLSIILNINKMLKSELLWMIARKNHIPKNKVLKQEEKHN